MIKAGCRQLSSATPRVETGSPYNEARLFNCLYVIAAAEAGKRLDSHLASTKPAAPFTSMGGHGMTATNHITSGAAKTTDAHGEQNQLPTLIDILITRAVQPTIVAYSADPQFTVVAVNNSALVSLPLGEPGTTVVA